MQEISIISFRISKDQEKILKSKTLENGFSKVSGYIRKVIFGSNEIFKLKKDDNLIIEEDFKMIRSERRSFYCPNELWEKIKKMNHDSSSKFIVSALNEKLDRININNK